MPKPTKDEFLKVRLPNILKRQIYEFCALNSIEVSSFVRAAVAKEMVQAGFMTMEELIESHNHEARIRKPYNFK